MCVILGLGVLIFVFWFDFSFILICVFLFIWIKFDWILLFLSVWVIKFLGKFFENFKVVELIFKVLSIFDILIFLFFVNLYVVFVWFNFDILNLLVKMM